VSVGGVFREPPLIPLFPPALCVRREWDFVDFIVDYTVPTEGAPRAFASYIVIFPAVAFHSIVFQEG